MLGRYCLPQRRLGRSLWLCTRGFLTFTKNCICERTPSVKEGWQLVWNRSIGALGRGRAGRPGAGI